MASSTTLLAGDLGGTKTLLTLAEFRRGYAVNIREERFASRDFASFDAVLAQFLQGYDKPIGCACFGLAGPTDGQRAKLTYLPWEIDGPLLAKRHRINRVLLVNDFAAAAHGLDGLGGGGLLTLRRGVPRGQAPRVILGAGTGLGVAGLVWCDKHYTVIPGEGGHLGFSPQTAEQRAFAAHLAASRGRVTVEDVVSGPGLSRIHAFLAGREVAAEEIGAAALAGDAAARRTVDFWLAAYGAFAGDLALHWLARGGVFIAGGIAAKLIPGLSPRPFLEAFDGKREHSEIAAAMPISLVTDERLGLLGALVLAQRATPA